MVPHVYGTEYSLPSSYASWLACGDRFFRLGSVNRFEQALLGERLRELPGYERQVDPRVVAGGQLGDDLLVGGVVGHRYLGPDLLLERLREVLGHVALPVRDRERLRAEVGFGVELVGLGGTGRLRVAATRRQESH